MTSTNTTTSTKAGFAATSRKTWEIPRGPDPITWPPRLTTCQTLSPSRLRKAARQRLIPTCTSGLWSITPAFPRVQTRPLLPRSEEHTSELQSQSNLVCRLLLEKKKKRKDPRYVGEM